MGKMQFTDRSYTRTDTSPHHPLPLAHDPSRKRTGFTLIELLLVIMIIGILLAVILPRAQRATTEARFAMIRQHASEIASFTTLWAQARLEAKFERAPFTMIDVFERPIQGADADLAGFSSMPLLSRYTGNENFKPVGDSMAHDAPPINPFNSESYFSRLNDHTDNAGVAVAPSHKPGLIYLTAVDESLRGDYHSRAYYFIITGRPDKEQPRWQGGMGTDIEQARLGVFVYRMAVSGQERFFGE